MHTYWTDEHVSLTTSHSLTHSLTLSLTHTLSHSHTHTRTHTYILSLSLSFSLPLSGQSIRFDSPYDVDGSLTEYASKRELASQVWWMSADYHRLANAHQAHQEIIRETEKRRESVKRRESLKRRSTVKIFPSPKPLQVESN